MERVVVNRSFTLYKTFYSDGVPTDPTGTPTVVVRRLSTGAVVTTGAVTDEAPAGTWSVTVSATQNTLLDTLTVTWTATVNATAQQYIDVVEVAGDAVFTIADARATSGLNATLNDNVTYRISTAQIIDARTEVERALEHELGFAMVPRYALETLDGDGGRVFMLSWPYIRRLRSVTVGGVADPDPSLYSVSDAGRIYAPAALTSGYSNVIVGYEHGMIVPPPGAKDVALALTKVALVGSAADARAATVSTGEQTTSFYTPGTSEPFDIPAANRFILSHTMRIGLA